MYQSKTNLSRYVRVCPVEMRWNFGMAVLSGFLVDLDEAKADEVSHGGVVEVCILGWGRRMVWETIEGSALLGVERRKDEMKNI